MDGDEPLQEALQAIGAAMRDNERVTSLGLARNFIKPQTLSTFCKQAVVKKRTLTQLDLSANPLGDQGGRVLAGALRVNGQLRELDVLGCGIGGDAAEQVRRVCKDKGIRVNIEEDPKLKAKGKRRRRLPAAAKAK